MKAAAVPRLLRLRDVLARVGLRRSTLYSRIASGAFPRPVPLGSPHAVGWVESEVDSWIAEQITARAVAARARGRALRDHDG